MTDIDERVVQLKFDSSDFETKTKSTFKVLDSLKEKLSFKEVSDSDNLQRIADNVEKMANKAYTIIDRMIDKIRDNLTNRLFNYLNENTIGQISAGWSKYADMTTAVATLKGQGYQMKDITDQLERLNYFTDETSFQFTNMVTEIGKFTASGQSLEDATTAMMGIANWAAMSGKNASEASRAMYQLSQALSAGQMRMVDWKSIQNLNMDTKQFRELVTEVGVELGTLRKNADGTFTTLVGKKAGSLSFDLNKFADTLTEGAWFTSDVMIETYKRYSEAVDEIRAIYDEGNYETIDGTIVKIGTTAEAMEAVTKTNEQLFEEFKKQQKLSETEIDKTLKRWKKVEKVTDEVVNEYSEMNNVSKELARSELNKQYADYLKEYSAIFGESEQKAEESLDKWKKYVSTFGMQAYSQSMEAKTFKEAIESAMDATSTTWTHIFQNIFGNYDEARVLWTDFANGLYEIFVERFADLNEVFKIWHDEIDEETGFTGRETFFQGVYAFFSALKTIITSIREAWDELFGGRDEGIQQAANNLTTFSQKFRITMFRFYNFVKQLKESTFFKNIAESLHNVLNLFKQIKYIIGGVFKQFLPAGSTSVTILEFISKKIKNITARLVPSEETASNIARILRGIVSVIRFIGKVILGIIGVVMPVAREIINIISNIIKKVLSLLASLGDLFFNFEKNISVADALKKTGEGLAKVLQWLTDIIKKGLLFVLEALKPVIGIIIELFRKLKNTITNLFSGEGGSALEKITEKVKNLRNRIKETWNEGETLKDIFNKFKGGTGFENFFDMIGEMCGNVVHRIGAVIAAIFHLEDATENGKFTQAMEKFKAVMITIWDVIKWVWTNLILPVVTSTLKGIGKSLDEIVVMAKNGDLVGILNRVREIFKTITSLAIVKVLYTINRLLGSGGILKIIRNTARTLKSVSKYFDAKALNERAQAWKTFTITILMLIAALFLLAQIPVDKFDNMWRACGLLAAVIGMVTVSILILSGVVQYCRFGLGALGLAFIGLTIFIIATLYALNKFGEAIENLQNMDRYLGAGGVIVEIGMALGIFIAIMAFIGSRAQGMLGVGVTLAALGLSMFAFAVAMEKTTELMDTRSMSQLAQALIILAGGIIVISAAMRLLGGAGGLEGMKFKKTLSSGLTTALTTVITVATFAFIMVPALDALSAKMSPENFEKYLQGLTLFSMLILSVSTSVYIISSANHHIITSLLSVIGFELLTLFIKNELIPLLNDIGIIDYDTAWKNIGLLTAIANGLATAFLLISIGIERIFKGIAKLKLGPVFVMIGGIIAIIYAVSNVSEMLESGKLSWAGIAAAIAILTAILIGMGVFVNSIKRTMSGNVVKPKATIKAIELVLGLFSAIGLTLMGLVAEAGWMFNGDTQKTLTVFLTVTGSILAVVIGLCTSFSLMIKSLKKSFKNVNDTDGTAILKAIKSMKSIFLTVAVTIGALIAEIVAANMISNISPETLMGIISGVAIVLIAVIGVISFTFARLFKALGKVAKGLNEAQLKQVNGVITRMIIMIGIIMAGMAAVLIAVGTSYTSGYEWQGALVIIAIMGAFIGIVLSMASAMQKLIKAINKSGMMNDVTGTTSNKYMALIITFGAIIAGIVTSIGFAFRNIAYAQGPETGHNIAMLIANVIAIIAVYTVVVYVLTKSVKTLISSMKYITLGSTKLAVIESVLGVIIVSILSMGTILDKLNTGDILDYTGAISVILVMLGIVGSIVGGVVLLLKTMKGMKRDAFKDKLIVIESALGAVLIIIWSLNALLPIIAEVSGQFNFSVISGIALLMLSVIGMVTVLLYSLIKSMKGLKIDKERVQIIITALAAVVLILTTVGLFILPNLNNINANSFEALLGIGAIIAIIGVVIVAMNQLLKFNMKNTIIGAALVVGMLFAIFGTITLFGDAVTKFLAAFKDINQAAVDRAFWFIFGLIGSLTLIGAAVGVLFYAFGPMLAVGLASVPLMLLALGGALTAVGDTFVSFLSQFRDISDEDIRKAMSAIMQMMLILGVLGAISGILLTISPAVGGGLLVGMAEMLLVLLGLGWVLNTTLNDALRDFFGIFTEVDWSSMWEGVVAVGALSAILMVIGIMAQGAFFGIVTIVGGLWLMSFALKALAEAILYLRVAFGDSDAIQAINDLALASLGQFNKTMGIKSPSKEMIKSGKYIDQGLAKGITKNMKTVKKASKLLGYTTNEEFCDELGIASPSKVFYENGRFIVKGLINGMDSQNDKLKSQGDTIGTAIGDGITNSVDNYDWSKVNIFGDSDLDKLAEQLASGGDSLGDSFLDSMFGKTAGWPEEAQKQYKDYEDELKKNNKRIAELTKGGGTLSEGQQREVNTLGLRNDFLKARMTDMEDLYGDKSKIATGFENIFSNFDLSDIGSKLGGSLDGGLLSGLTGKGTFLGDIGGWFKKTFNIGGENEKTLNDAGEEVGGHIGSGIATEVENKVKELVNGNDQNNGGIVGWVTGIFSNLGSTLIDAFNNAFGDFKKSGIYKAFMWVTTSGEKYHRYLAEIGEESWTEFYKNYGTPEQKAADSLSGLSEAFKKESEVNFDNYNEAFDYNNEILKLAHQAGSEMNKGYALFSSGSDRIINGHDYSKYNDKRLYEVLSIAKALGDETALLGSDAFDEYLEAWNKMIIHNDNTALRKIIQDRLSGAADAVNQSSTGGGAAAQAKRDAQKMHDYYSDAGDSVSQDIEEKAEKTVNYVIGQNRGGWTEIINTSKQSSDQIRDYIKQAIETGNGGVVDSEHNYIVTNLNAIVDYVAENLKVEVPISFALDDNAKQINASESWKSIISTLFGKTEMKATKAGKSIEDINAAIFDAMMYGKRKGWVTQNAITGMWEVQMLDELISYIEKLLGIASPSKLFIFFGEMIDQGMMKGLKIDEDGIFKAMDDIVDGVIDSGEELSAFTIDGLFDDDANYVPTLTPIWDDTNVRSGIDSLDASIYKIGNPTVNAAVNTMFDRGSAIDYTNKFASLEKAINNMSELLYGAITDTDNNTTDVNITMEPNVSGLFDAIVNESRLRNRRVPGTGLG